MIYPLLTILDFSRLALFVYHDETVNNKYLSDFIKTDNQIDSKKFDPHKITHNGFYEVMICPLTQSPAAQGHPFYASFFVKVFNQKAVGAVIAIRESMCKLISQGVFA